MQNCNYILIAEDDQEDRFIIGESISEANSSQKVVFVENGEEVLSALQEGEELPALIVLDLNMPKLTGKETLQMLKSNEELKHIPVVIYSTSFNKKEIQECIDYGAKEYIRKPNTFAECFEVAKRLIALCSSPLDVHQASV